GCRRRAWAWKMEVRVEVRHRDRCDARTSTQAGVGKGPNRPDRPPPPSSPGITPGLRLVGGSHRATRPLGVGAVLIAALAGYRPDRSTPSGIARRALGGGIEQFLLARIDFSQDRRWQGAGGRTQFAILPLRFAQGDDVP